MTFIPELPYLTINVQNYLKQSYFVQGGYAYDQGTFELIGTVDPISSELIVQE